MRAKRLVLFLALGLPLLLFFRTPNIKSFNFKGNTGFLSKFFAIDKLSEDSIVTKKFKGIGSDGELKQIQVDANRPGDFGLANGSATNGFAENLSSGIAAGAGSPIPATEALIERETVARGGASYGTGLDRFASASGPSGAAYSASQYGSGVHGSAGGGFSAGSGIASYRKPNSTDSISADQTELAQTLQPGNVGQKKPQQTQLSDDKNSAARLLSSTSSSPNPNTASESKYFPDNEVGQPITPPATAGMGNSPDNLTGFPSEGQGTVIPYNILDPIMTINPESDINDKPPDTPAFATLDDLKNIEFKSTGGPSGAPVVTTHAAEPATLVLLGSGILGIMGLGARARRKRK